MRCKLFNCDMRHGNYCCAECPHRIRCKNPCQNSPKRCGQFRPETIQELMKEHGVRKVTKLELQKIFDTGKPRGLFYHGTQKGGYVGIDNRTGDAWTEEFKLVESCVQWLIGKAPREEYGP